MDTPPPGPVVNTEPDFMDALDDPPPFDEFAPSDSFSPHDLIVSLLRFTIRTSTHILIQATQLDREVTPLYDSLRSAFTIHPVR